MKPGKISNTQAFRIHAAFSPEEILAAGGATAFGLKTGKNNQAIVSALENTVNAEPFTKEEWNSLIAQLDRDK